MRIINYIKAYLKGTKHYAYKNLLEIEQSLSYLNHKNRAEWVELIKSRVCDNDIIAQLFGNIFSNEIGNNVYQSEVDKLMNLKCNMITHEEWDILRFVSSLKGYLELSHICRNKAIESIIITKGLNSIFKRVSVYIERGNYHEAKKTLQSVWLLPLRKSKMYKDYNDVVCILDGSKQNYDSYGSYLKGKRVIIIGPANGEQRLNDYDELNDVIIRFTYRGKDNIPHVNRNIPVNVSYYNVEASEKVVKTKPNFLDDLDYYCCRIPQIEKTDCRGRYEKVYDIVIPFGIILSGQACMVDLLQYNPKSIYVTNYNMYYSQKKHEDKYEIGDYKPFITYAYHDIEGNFILAKKLYEKGDIECDNTLRMILELSAEQYMIGLQSMDSNK